MVIGFTWYICEIKLKGRKREDVKKLLSLRQNPMTKGLSENKESVIGEYRTSSKSYQLVLHSISATFYTTKNNLLYSDDKTKCGTSEMSNQK